MYKNIEILNKEKFKTMKFVDIKASEVSKNIGIIPIGFSEVLDMSYFAPVLIMGNKEREFAAFTGISKDVTIFNNDKIYIPRFTQTYPFVNTIAKNENDELKNVISIDNGKNVSKRKKFFIFNKTGELQKKANEKIKMLKDLAIQRDVSKKIIKELDSHGLLLKKNFTVKHEEEERTLIETFYIVNREKLITLDDTVLALWAKKGWMSVIDCHIKSLVNFQKVLES